MHHRSPAESAGLPPSPASALLLLLAGGEDPKPAEDAGGTDTCGPVDTKGALVFSPLALKIPAMQGPGQGVEQTGALQGLRGRAFRTPTSTPKVGRTATCRR